MATLTKIEVRLEAFSGRAAFTMDSDVIEAKFTGGEDSYIISYALKHSEEAAGFEADIALSNWEHIKYFALGFMCDGKFHHIKVKHCSQKYSTAFRVHPSDLIWQLENAGNTKKLTKIDNIRFFIKGTPNPDGACLRVNNISLLSSEVSEFDTALVDGTPEQQRAMSVVVDYLRHSFRNYQTQAKNYLLTGECPLTGNKNLVWPMQLDYPSSLQEVSTFRFSWHAMHPAIMLLLYSHEHQHVGALMAARSFVECWLNDNFFAASEDKKYAWYDHGTAERLLAFMLLKNLLVKFQPDYRFVARLDFAIVAHAELLASDAFYAYNQPARYHNHAWFQDAALIAAAICYSGHCRADTWLNIAIQRFEDQLDVLIVRDGGFAIFIENSIGYHHGVQRLATFAGQLAELSGRATDIPQIAKELVAWSDFLRYPDGRAPAQGDTFRLPPRTGKDVRRGTAWDNPGCTVLPKAGYAVIKGNHDNKPWMLCLFNTSLSPTHKHEDNLSITFWFDGIEWIIDPSFYSHEYLQDIPSKLRNSFSHNGIALDRDYNDKNSFYTDLRPKVDGKYGVEAEHNAYSNCKIIRDITVVEPGNIVINDSVSSDVDEDFSSFVNFIFSENVAAFSNGNTIELTSSDSDYSIAIMLENHEGEIKIKNTPVGVGFLQAESVNSVCLDLGVKSRLSWALNINRKKKSTIKSVDVCQLGLKASIIGSCVTRDAFQFSNFSNLLYFARTSVVSLVSLPVQLDAEKIKIEGAFEKRMVLADFEKTALSSINEFSPDFIVLDFIDERFDLCKVGDSYVTRSNYMISGVSSDEYDFEVVRKKNAKSVWGDSCKKLASVLSSMKVPIILHKAWWATHFMNHDTGELEQFSTSDLVIVQEQNEMLRFFYQTLIENLPSIIEVEVDSSLVYSDFAHKWGRDFFHYSERYYKALMEEISQVVASNC